MKPHPFKFTVFPTLTASAMQVREVESFDAFCALLKDKPDTYARKADMPLLCPMLFSGERSGKGALRSNDTVVEIWGVCGDHDSGSMTLDDAAARLAAARVECLLYTTASHTPGAPRWRVVAPFVAPTKDVGEHLAAVERLNFILDGALKPESFTLSQSFYFGRVKGVEYQTRYVKGRGIDTLVKLERKPKSASIIDLDARREQMKLPVLGGSIEWPGFKEELHLRLRHVPSGTGRERWRNIGMGIHHACGGSLEGFEIWHAWSAGANDTSYKGYEDCLYQWKSFKADHAKPVTWGTVRHYLDEFAPPKVKAPTPGKLPMVIDIAGDLFDKEIQPVERLTLGRLEFTPGVTVLAGKPKHGKSWLAMGFAVAFTTGDEYVESRAACAMQAVYVACDDSSRRRFANRLRAFKPKMRPDGLLVVTSIDPAAGSSLELLGALLKTHPAIRFVVIDTLSAFRESQRSDSPYQQEYDEVLALNDWAHDHNVCVLLVHHLRKGEVDIADPYESISGTLGLQGACDGLMVLYRRDLESDVDEALDQKLAGLWYRGRDLDNDVATGVALADGRWTVFGRGRIVDVFAAATRREILRVLESDPARWWTAKEIHAAGEFNCKAESVKRTASRMARSKEIEAHHGNRADGQPGGFKAIP